MSPEEYNEESAERFGWSPEDLGLTEDASPLEIKEAVEAFQSMQGLHVDGKLGPMTWGRLQTHIEYEKMCKSKGIAFAK